MGATEKPVKKLGASKRKKFEELMRQEGYDDKTEFLEAVAFDSVCPGICINEGCDYTTEVEPDCRNGWCENCEAGTVKSALDLMGVI